jgi:hypothetical protein
VTRSVTVVTVTTRQGPGARVTETRAETSRRHESWAPDSESVTVWAGQGPSPLGRGRAGHQTARDAAGSLAGESEFLRLGVSDQVAGDSESLAVT